MTWKECWFADRMSIFILEEELPYTYLGGAYIKSVQWKTEEHSKCLHCGTVSLGLKCSGCGSSGKDDSHYRLGKALVTIEDVLPRATRIFQLSEGATIDILHHCCGRRDYYSTECLAFRFSDCRIADRYIHDLVSPEESESIMLSVVIECDVELYPEGLQEEEGGK